MEEDAKTESVMMTRIELERALSATAAERVTWEAARDLVRAEAARLFINGEDILAAEVRAIADKFEAKRDEASMRQRDLLRDMGVVIR